MLPPRLLIRDDAGYARLQGSTSNGADITHFSSTSSVGIGIVYGVVGGARNIQASVGITTNAANSYTGHTAVNNSTVVAPGTAPTTGGVCMLPSRAPGAGGRIMLSATQTLDEGLSIAYNGSNVSSAHVLNLPPSTAAVLTHDASTTGRVCISSDLSRTEPRVAFGGGETDAPSRCSVGSGGFGAGSGLRLESISGGTPATWDVRASAANETVCINPSTGASLNFNDTEGVVINTQLLLQRYLVARGPIGVRVTAGANFVRGEIVTINTSGAFIKASGVGSRPVIGVAVRDALIGTELIISTEGVHSVLMGGLGITRGQFVVSDGSGRGASVVSVSTGTFAVAIAPATAGTYCQCINLVAENS